MEAVTQKSDQHIDPEALHNIVEHQGVFAHRGGAGVIDFQFTYLGFPFAVRAEAGARGSTVNIRAVLGHLPYTSESRRGRAGAMSVIQASSQAMGQRVRLGDQQRLIMSDTRHTKDTLTPVNLMSVMVEMLLEAKPYLSILSDYVIPTAISSDEAAKADTKDVPDAPAEAAPAIQAG